MGLTTMRHIENVNWGQLKCHNNNDIHMYKFGALLFIASNKHHLPQPLNWQG